MKIRILKKAVSTTMGSTVSQVLKNVVFFFKSHCQLFESLQFGRSVYKGLVNILGGVGILYFHQMGEYPTVHMYLYAQNNMLKRVTLSVCKLNFNKSVFKKLSIYTCNLAQNQSTNMPNLDYSSFTLSKVYISFIKLVY